MSESELARVLREARMAGMSYGQYVARQYADARQNSGGAARSGFVPQPAVSEDKRYANTLRFANAYNEGLTDYQISQRLGLAYQSVQDKRRKIFGLPSNRAGVPPDTYVIVRYVEQKVRGAKNYELVYLNHEEFRLYQEKLRKGGGRG